MAGALPEPGETTPAPATVPTGKLASRHLAKLSSHLLEARRLALTGHTIEFIRQAIPQLEWVED